MLGLVVGDIVGGFVLDDGCFVGFRLGSEVGCLLGSGVATGDVVGSNDIVGLRDVRSQVCFHFLDDLGLLADLDRRLDGLWLVVGDTDGFACLGALELLDA